MNRFLWLLSIIMVGTYLCGPIADPDLWWHIVVGRWILANTAVPTVDLWTVEGFGKPWLAYSWLPEMIIARVESSFGLLGLVALQMLVCCGFVLSVCWMTTYISGGRFVGFCFGALGALSGINSLSLRPQVISWICFALALLVAEATVRHGMRLRYIGALAAIFIVWGNSHFSAVLGIVAVASWLVLSRDMAVWGGSAAVQARHVGLFVAVAFVSSCITPYGGKEWLTMFETSAHPALFQQIAEFSPAHIWGESTAIVLLMTIIFFMFLHSAPRSVELSKIGALLVFLLMGLGVVKFLPYAAIYLSALLSLVWHRGSDRQGGIGPLGEGIQRLIALAARMPRWGAAIVVGGAIAVNLADRVKEPLSNYRLPRRAMDYFFAKSLPFPLLNGFSEGGYVLYRLSDPLGITPHRVTLDGRTNLISLSLWRVYDAASRGTPRWRELVERFEPETILWRSEAPLVSLLLATGSWCEVYRDAKEFPSQVAFSLLTKKGTVGCPS